MACTRLRKRRSHVAEVERDVARRNVAHCQPAALVGDMADIGAGAQLEQLGREMLGAAVARRGIEQLAGLRLGQCHQVGDRLGRMRRRDHQQLRHRGQQRDRGEVLRRPERHLGLDQRIDRMGEGAQQQGAAVGRGLGHNLVADHAGGAGLVLDDDGGAQCLLQGILDEPRRRVGAAARRIGHDDPDLPGKTLGANRSGKKRGACAEQDGASCRFHFSSQLSGA